MTFFVNEGAIKTIRADKAFIVMGMWRRQRPLFSTSYRKFVMSEA